MGIQILISIQIQRTLDAAPQKDTNINEIQK